MDSEDDLERVIAGLVDAAGRGNPYDIELGAYFRDTESLSLNRPGHLQSRIQLAMQHAERRQSRPIFRKRPDKPGLIIPWLDLISHDGFRRERALRLLSAPAPNAFLLTMLLRRLNDWVPEVSQAAREAVERVAVETSASLVAEALCSTLVAAENWGRLWKADRETLFRLVEQPRIAAAIADNLVSQVRGPVSRLMVQLFRTPALDADLPRLARDARHPAVRARAYRMLLDGKAVWPDGWRWRWIDKPMGVRVRERIYAERSVSSDAGLLKTLEAAFSDRSVAVRRVAGDVLIANWQTLGPQADAWAQTLAASENSSLAERGRFVLRILAENSGGVATI